MLLRVRELNLSVFNGEGGSAFPLALIEVLLACTVCLYSALMLEVVAIIGAATLFASRYYVFLVILLLVSSLFYHFGLFNRYSLSNGCVLVKPHD